MRAPFAPLFVIVVLVATIALPSDVAAKTSITVSPQSGSPGTTVEIVGFGFPPQEDINIGLIASGQLSTDPRDEFGLIVRDDSQLSNALHLATVRADEHSEFITTAKLPSREKIEGAFSSGEGGYEIIATLPTDGGGIFVARASFTMTAGSLSDTSGGSFFSPLVIFLAAGLAVAAATLSALAWRRRTTRRYAGGLTHAHTSDRRPAGP